MRILAVFFLLATVGCATNRTAHVLPGPEGVHEALARDVVQEDAESAAISKAKDFCRDQSLPIEVIDHRVEYAGTMDENTRNTLRTGSQVAIATGGALLVTEPKQRSVAASVAAAGAAGYASTNTPDYLARVQFRCVQQPNRNPDGEVVRPWPYW